MHEAVTEYLICLQALTPSKMHFFPDARNRMRAEKGGGKLHERSQQLN